LIIGLALVVSLAACNDDGVTTVGGCAIDHGAECPGGYLHAGNMAGADLYGADFARADLSNTVLTSANLVGADLRGADLRGADLRYALLGYARLDGARLDGAKLDGADLTDASLKGTGVTEGQLSTTTRCRTVVDPGTTLTVDCARPPRVVPAPSP
jgi:uncharacterized protein YjbI with pentapeptide repeats